MLSREHGDATPASECPRMQPINLSSRQDAEPGSSNALAVRGWLILGSSQRGAVQCGGQCGARRRGSDRAGLVGVRGVCLCAAGHRSAARTGWVQRPAGGLVLRVRTRDHPAGTRAGVQVRGSLLQPCLEKVQELPAPSRHGHVVPG